VKTGLNLAEFSTEGYDSKRAVVPTMMMKMTHNEVLFFLRFFMHVINPE
jgi:hypothetical protein